MTNSNIFFTWFLMQSIVWRLCNNNKLFERKFSFSWKRFITFSFHWRRAFQKFYKTIRKKLFLISTIIKIHFEIINQIESCMAFFYSVHTIYVEYTYTKMYTIVHARTSYIQILSKYNKNKKSSVHRMYIYKEQSTRKMNKKRSLTDVAFFISLDQAPCVSLHQNNNKKKTFLTFPPTYIDVSFISLHFRRMPFLVHYMWNLGLKILPYYIYTGLYKYKYMWEHMYAKTM